MHVTNSAFLMAFYCVSCLAVSLHLVPLKFQGISFRKIVYNVSNFATCIHREFHNYGFVNMIGCNSHTGGRILGKGEGVGCTNCYVPVAVLLALCQCASTASFTSHENGRWHLKSSSAILPPTPGICSLCLPCVAISS